LLHARHGTTHCCLLGFGTGKKRIPACARLLSIVREHPPDRGVKQAKVGIVMEKEIHLRSDTVFISKPYPALALLSECLYLKEPHSAYGFIQENRYIQAEVLNDDKGKTRFAQDFLNERYNRSLKLRFRVNLQWFSDHTFRLSLVSRHTGKDRDRSHRAHLQGGHQEMEESQNAKENRQIQSHGVRAPDARIRIWDEADGPPSDHEHDDPKPRDMWPPDGHEHVKDGVQTGAVRKKA
jgi:hypothetical protein